MHAIIKKFAGEEISCLEELKSVLSKLSRGARVPLEYISHMDRHRRKVMVAIHSSYMVLNECVFADTGEALVGPWASYMKQRRWLLGHLKGHPIL